jgi:hypothetical protein
VKRFSFGWRFVEWIEVEFLHRMSATVQRSATPGTAFGIASHRLPLTGINAKDPERLLLRRGLFGLLLLRGARAAWGVLNGVVLGALAAVNALVGVGAEQVLPGFAVLIWLIHDGVLSGLFRLQVLSLPVQASGPRLGNKPDLAFSVLHFPMLSGVVEFDVAGSGDFKPAEFM